MLSFWLPLTDQADPALLPAVERFTGAFWIIRVGTDLLVGGCAASKLITFESFVRTTCRSSREHL